MDYGKIKIIIIFIFIIVFIKGFGDSERRLRFIIRNGDEKEKDGLTTQGPCRRCR